MTSMFLKEALLLLAGLAAEASSTGREEVILSQKHGGSGSLRLSGGHRRLSAPDWKDGDGVEGENLLV